MPYTLKQMAARIKWLKDRESELRAGAITDHPVALGSLSPLAAANTLDEALQIIAELAGRLSAAEELLE